MKKFLLATAAVLASTSAYAADYTVDHPFYTPALGKFVSTTALDYEHTTTHAKNIDWKERNSEITFSEKVKYGITNDIQVGLTVTRDWGKDKEKIPTLDWSDIDRGYINAWGLNVGYNVINDGKAFLNVDLEFRQMHSRLSNAGASVKTHEREFLLSVLGGYNFSEATVFGSITYDRQFYSNVNNIDKERSYTLEAGAFKAFNDRISARTSLSAEIDETKNAEEKTYWWNVGANYSVSKKMAVGVSAGYMLGNDKDHANAWNPDTHSAYKLGVDFTVEF